MAAPREFAANFGSFGPAKRILHEGALLRSLRQAQRFLRRLRLRCRVSLISLPDAESVRLRPMLPLEETEEAPLRFLAKVHGSDRASGSSS